MQHLSAHPDKSIRVINKYLSERVNCLQGEDRIAIIAEFKEWLVDENEIEENIWSIPDLTDDGLRDFFQRAISRK